MHGDAPAARARRDIAVVLGVQAVAAVLVAGWFASGNASAPDAGLEQVDVLYLSERVPGVEPVDGRPTLFVVSCDTSPVRTLSPRYGLRITDDPTIADRLALPRAVTACEDGYVLVDADGLVRYRTYDPDWEEHSFEQEVLLEHLDGEHG